MPKSGAMAPYLVMNRDAAVAGVFSVDGEAGSIDLTGKYVQISAYNTRVGAVEQRVSTVEGQIVTINQSISDINTAVGSNTNAIAGKAAKGVNNDITEIKGLNVALSIAQGGTGAKDVDQARNNLKLGRFRELESQTLVYSPDSGSAFRILDTGEWGGVKVSDGTPIALTIPFGGTGGKTVSEARTNLEIDRLKQTATGTSLQAKNPNINLNLPDTGAWGVYDTAATKWIPLGLDQGGTNGLMFVYQTESTMIRSATNPKFSLFVRDAGGANGKIWGAYDEVTFKSIPLDVEQGGTGGSTPWDAATNIQTIRTKPSRFKPGDSILDLAWKNSTGFITGMIEGGLLGAWMDVTSFDNAARMQLIGFYGSDQGTKGLAHKVFNPNSNSWYAAAIVRDSSNTTVDSNGFIKVASPIVKIKGDGTVELNEESEGATVERIDVGVYKISGVLGYNSDPSWGGIDGGYTVPQNGNGLALLWVDSKVEADGSIILRTYHREHLNVPEFAKNRIEGIKDGEPIDIPAGRWVDLRVEMPEDSVYNKKFGKK